MSDLDMRMLVRILLVSRDPATRNSLGKLFNKLPGSERVVFSSSFEAIVYFDQIESIPERQPTLIMFDSHLPFIRGHELWEIMNQMVNFDETPYVILHLENEAKTISLQCVRVMGINEVMTVDETIDRLKSLILQAIEENVVPSQPLRVLRSEQAPDRDSA